ncbi:hypothetical protein BGZ52_000312, partial [Haplosporangium bisporale]
MSVFQESQTIDTVEVAKMLLYLHPQDFFAYIRISSPWYHACIPTVWHTIDDSASYGATSSQTLQPSSNPIFDKVMTQAKGSDKNKKRVWLLH